MSRVATQERPRLASYDWNKEAKLEDFFDKYKDWMFD